MHQSKCFQSRILTLNIWPHHTGNKIAILKQILCKLYLAEKWENCVVCVCVYTYFSIYIEHIFKNGVGIESSWAIKK